MKTFIQANFYIIAESFALAKQKLIVLHRLSWPKKLLVLMHSLVNLVVTGKCDFKRTKVNWQTTSTPAFAAAQRLLQSICKNEQLSAADEDSSQLTFVIGRAIAADSAFLRGVRRAPKYVHCKQGFDEEPKDYRTRASGEKA